MNKLPIRASLTPRSWTHYTRPACFSYTTTTTSRHAGPFRMAVIGSGPAGFYTAYRVMSRLPMAKVDMYETLPVPFGLVRFGVAPDHPEVKNCRDKFDEIASSSNFTFIGNASVGDAGPHPESQTIQLAALLRNYDAVLFAYGAATDRSLGVPGESSLGGIYSAREFVGWYNGLPECANLAPDLSKGDEAVIIGQGNVALDVARMLLEDVDSLRKTDIAEHALEALSRSRIRRVHVVGRRGPMQAAFTIKEVRELMKIPGVAFHPAEASLIPPDLKHLPRPAKRLMEVVVKGSQSALETATKSWSLDFCLSPKAFLPDEQHPGHVGTSVFEQTDLSSRFDPAAQPRLTGREMSLPSSTVFRSIGYKSSPLPGFDEAGVLFDQRRGVIMNDGMGRVLQNTTANDGGSTVRSTTYPGLYCAGWVKRGPTGVIANTMQDAFESGDSIVQDWLSGLDFLNHGGGEIRGGWEGICQTPEEALKVVHWPGWKKIDEAELARGMARGKEREKFTSTAEMLEAAS